MLILLLHLLTLCSMAFAGEQKLTYELTMDGKAIGQRTLTLRYLQGSTGEVRILETYTEVSATVAGKSWTMKNRATLKAGASPGFTSNIEENGALREVQGRMLPDRRWSVIVTEKGKSQTWTLRASEVSMSSLDLFDPVRHSLLLSGGPVNMLVAETGGIEPGPVEDLGEGTLTIGGQEIVVQRAAWTPSTGRMELAWSTDGLLVSYQTQVAGRTLEARLVELPPPPSFGEVQTPALQTGGTVNEESL